MPPAPPEPPIPPPWPRVAAHMPRRGSRGLMVAMLVIGLTVGIAIGAGVLLLFDGKSASVPPAPSFSEQQVSDAKGKVCNAYDEVHKEIGTNSARDQGTDPTQQLAVTGTIRQAFLAGSVYLLTTLSEEPATPSGLATAVRKLAIAYQEVTIGYLNGKTNSELESTLRAGDEATLAIEGLCT